jgi:thiol-disulfide isomerase/thioredoxin
MLRPQIDDMVRKQQVNHGGLVGLEKKTGKENQHHMSVRRPTTLSQLNSILAEANDSCAVVFFTSPTCRPCQMLYPLFDELAGELGQKAILIMVDVSKSFDIGLKYAVRNTPTFMTFLRGSEENRWAGADPGTLRGNIQLLVQMAWPAHPHDSLRLPTLLGSSSKPVSYSKVPPIEKLKAKMGPSAQDSAVEGVLHFVSARDMDGAAESTLPDLESFSNFLRSAPSEVPLEILFTIVDTLRAALVDPRFSGYYAEEKDHLTVVSLLTYVNSLKDCPYSLRLVTLQTACNLFSSPLYPQHILTCPILTEPIVQLITTSLLDDKHHNVRVAAASLSFNLSVANNGCRIEQNHESLPEGDQVELAASLLEAIGVEEDSAEALKGFLLAFGYLVYHAPKNGELVDLIKSMDAQSTLLGKKKLFPNEPLLKEIGEELLGKGLE